MQYKFGIIKEKRKDFINPWWTIISFDEYFDTKEYYVFTELLHAFKYCKMEDELRPIVLVEDYYKGICVAKPTLVKIEFDKFNAMNNSQLLKTIKLGKLKDKKNKIK